MIDTLTNPPENRAARRTRQALLDAGLQLIMQKGYDAVKVTDIVRLADYGRSTFYVHFKDKEDLAWALLRYQMTELDRFIGEQVSGLDSPQREHKAWLLIFQAIDRQREFFQQMDGELALRLRHWQVEQLNATFTKQLEAGVFSLMLDVPAPIAARFVVGALVQVLDYWLENPDTGDAQYMADLFFTLVYREKPIHSTP